MPSPPISPTPRRWRSSGTDEPHPDYAALLSSFDRPPETTSIEESGSSPWRRGANVTSTDDDPSSEFLSAPGSPQRLVPEIKTTSPSPQRPIYTRESSQSSDMGSSPLPSPPNRARMFGDASNSAGRMVYTGSVERKVTGPREAMTSTCQPSYSAISDLLTHSISKSIGDKSSQQPSNRSILCHPQRRL
jgi:hypothetical protein